MWTTGDRVTCLKTGPGDTELRRSRVSRAVFLNRCAVFSTGLPVVEGQDLERGGPTSAGEVERAAGNRGAAGLHSAPTRHRYADTLCRSLSFCLSVRPSASERPRSAALSPLCVRVVLSPVCPCSICYCTVTIRASLGAKGRQVNRNEYNMKFQGSMLKRSAKNSVFCN